MSSAQNFTQRAEALSTIFTLNIGALIVLGFNDTSTLACHFVSSPREREKRDRRDDEREGQGRKRIMNESEETEEIKHSPSTLNCCKDSRPCPTVSQYQLDAPVTQDRAVEIPCPTCPTCPISLRTSKKFQFTCPGTSDS